MADIGTVAIIGAGIAGLACARGLADAGVATVVFDKSRGLGGRMSTRRSTLGAVDHGAVAVTAQPAAAPYGDTFAAYLAEASRQGAASFWPVAQGWVGLPGMSGLVQPLARGLTVSLGCEVTGLHHSAMGWRLQGNAVPDVAFDHVVLAIPQPQAMALLAPWPAMQHQIASARMQAVWTALAWFDQRLPLTADLIRHDGGRVAQAIRNSAKPSRNGAEAWVLHAASPWTNANLELDKPAAAALLLAAFFADFGLRPTPPLSVEGHRWRFGLTAQPLGRAFARDADLQLSVCGDWCLGDNAGDAFGSGTALAAALLAL